MPFCTQCGSSHDAGDAFCASCGNRLGDGAGGGGAPSASAPAASRLPTVAAVTSDASQSDWFDPYKTNGFAKAVEAPGGIEEWRYSSGVVVCAEGPVKGREYTWDGRYFAPKASAADSENWPRGEFEASTGTLTWRVPRRASFSAPGAAAAAAGAGGDVVLYEYVFDEDAGTAKNVKGLARLDPERYVSFVHWVATGEIRRGGSAVQLAVEDGSDVKEGTTTRWQLSNFPLPAGLFVAMYARVEQILEEAELRAKRVYSTCGKLVLSSAGEPMLCSFCVEDGRTSKCVVCETDLRQGDQHTGQTCKACAVKRSTCYWCGDRLASAPGGAAAAKAGYLCAAHGLGKAGKNCCRRNFTVPRTAQY